MKTINIIVVRFLFYFLKLSNTLSTLKIEFQSNSTYINKLTHDNNILLRYYVNFGKCMF